MPRLAEAAQQRRARGLVFVRRVYPMRNLGLLLLAVPYVSVLSEQHAPASVWGLLALNVLVWPHAAFLLARRAADPIRAEYASLMVDVVFGAFWIALSGISLMPAAAMVSMLAADRLGAGGWRLLGRAVAVGIAGFAVAWLLLGCPYHPWASPRTLLLSWPPVMIYMLALSHVTYRMAGRIRRHNRELNHLSLTDASVDLANRRGFNLCIAELVAACDGRARTLLLIDVDRFKAINDGYGHMVGDAVLYALAALLRREAGDTGFPARIGGDEFALLLVAGREQGEAAAGRIRDAVAGLAFDGCPGLRVGVSIGVATLPDAGRVDQWIGAADRAMYADKRGRRHG